MVELAEDTFIVFGGNDLTSFTSNIQKLEVSGTTSTWTQIYSAIGADAPTARDHHTMTHFVDGFTVVFGGSDGTFRNDVWEMELSGMHAVWNHLTNAGTIPSVRAGHTMTALSDNTGVMFGGYNYDNYLNDVFQLQRSGDTATWMQLTDAGNPPSGRSVHAMTGLADGTFVIFGGYDGADYLSDIYQLEVSGTTATWTMFSNVGDVPSNRNALGMVELGSGAIVVFGGTDGEGSFNDVYQLVLSTAVLPTTVLPTTAMPTTAPATAVPTTAPTTAVSTIASTTVAPTIAPTTVAPTIAPTTAAPTSSPTTAAPTTAAPTTAAPTSAPTTAPTSAAPTSAPTTAPTSAAPTSAPTTAPTTQAPTYAAPTFGGRQLELSGSASWTELSNLGDIPSARDGHIMLVLADGSALVFGGGDDSSCFNDVYQLEQSFSPTTSPTLSSLTTTGDVTSDTSAGNTADVRPVFLVLVWSVARVLFACLE